MPIHFHTLAGCSPTPLANYLKALGILRLVSEQADSAARGAWRDESFVLATTLSGKELADFFLTRYAPTPLVSPWNSGSGFLKNDNKVAPLLRRFEASPLLRLASYQRGAKAARALCDALSDAKQAEVAVKEEAKKIKDKRARDAFRANPDYIAREGEAKRRLAHLRESFRPECRLHWRGQELEWLNAAMIIGFDEKGKLKAKFPSLLGTGGNDGNLDFTDNFRQRFAELFDIDHADTPVALKTRDLLAHALSGLPAVGAGGSAIGQFAPGSAGGANSTNGLDGNPSVNPWDFILFMEGTVLFGSAASRRLNASAAVESAPFSLRAQHAGHLSSSAGDKAARGEQWMPLWAQFASLGEIRSLLSEGRAQLGRSATREPLDMARAVARLGVARGVSAFVRYAYMERNGQSNFAVPLGCWRVLAQPRQDLFADLDTYLVRLHRAAREDHAAGALVAAAKQLDDALLAATTAAALPRAWQNILLALADLDALAASGTFGHVAPALCPEWIPAADDGSPEFRLALSLANQYGIRHHFLPLNRFGSFDKNDRSSVVCFGRNLVADLVAFVDRRLVDASRSAFRALDQTPVKQNFCVRLADLDDFLAGRLDLVRLLRLSRGLMALDARELKNSTATIATHGAFSGYPGDAFALFRFCLPPRHWRIDIPVRADIYRRLASGDMSAASRLAFQHLRAHGISPAIQVCTGDARLLAASLAFPLSTASRDALLKTITNNQQEKSR